MHKQQIEKQLDDEVCAYVDMVTDERIAAGMSPSEARRTALAESGGLEQVKQAVRDHRAGTGIELIWQDLRFALRQLRKSLGFAITAVLTLALGIGSTTVIYSLVDGVLLRPLPLPHPERLVAAYTQETHTGEQPTWEHTSYPNYLDWRDRNQTFSGIAVVDGDQRLVSRANGSEGALANVNRVSANYFDVLGIQPQLGRNFASDEDQPGRHITVISYGFWQRVFAGDPRALGATVLISDTAYTVIGIMPKGFIEPRSDSADLWTSFALNLEGNAPGGKAREAGIAEVVGRLKPGVTPQQASADLSEIQSNLAREYPENRFRASVALQSKLADLTGNIRPALLLFMAAVLAVLLIVCTNISGLMLARTMKRRGEMALRAALGASQMRILRQLLIEALLLGLLGALIGTGLAFALLHLALPFVPADIPRVGEVSLDARVLSFAIATSMFCAVLSSLFPAWKLSRTHPIDAMREQGHSSTRGKSTYHFQSTLVIVQTSMSVVLLIAAGLLIRGFVNMRHVDVGFNSDHLFQFLLPLTPTRYPDARKPLFYNDLLPKLAAVPGVRKVSAGYPLPLQGAYKTVSVEINGKPNPPDHPETTLVGVAEPGFFETLGIPLLYGRTFTAADNDPMSPFVAIVNQAFVKRYFQDEDPIGRRIRPNLGRLQNQSNNFDPSPATDREIIGVVADTQQYSITDEPQPMAVFPYAQASSLMRPTVVLRVAGDPMHYERPAKTIVSELDPFLFLTGPRSMTMQIARITGSQRFETSLVASFAGVALFLAGLGLYATLAAMVASRTREIGLRMAMGADRRDVARLFLTRAAILVLFGLSIGTLIAVIVSRGVATADWWRPLLFGVSLFDLRTYVSILLVLGVVSFGACFVPVRRAVRVDPMRVLRDE